MLTKRMMLGAGALALALAVAGCSKDGVGGATGMDETAMSPARAAPPRAPAAVAEPPGGGSVQPPPAGDDGVSFAANGHQYVILVVPGANGGDVTRIVQDGAILLEARGTPASLATATNANITLFSDGQAVFSDVVTLQGNVLASIPEQFLAAPNPPGGPQLQQAFPCAAEISAFGAASAWLSLDLYMARAVPGSVSLKELFRAAGAVVATGVLAIQCLQSHW